MKKPLEEMTSEEIEAMGYRQRRIEMVIFIVLAFVAVGVAYVVGMHDGIYRRACFPTEVVRDPLRKCVNPRAQLGCDTARMRLFLAERGICFTYHWNEYNATDASDEDLRTENN